MEFSKNTVSWELVEIKMSGKKIVLCYMLKLTGFVVPVGQTESLQKFRAITQRGIFI
jgi:hypothetical protein